MISCSKETCDSTPSISSPIISNINYNSVSVSGQITPSECNSEVISQGFLISKSELPTLTDYTKKINTSGNSFQKDVEGLELNTTYYVRSFFINNDGEFYSAQKSFKTFQLEVVFENFSEFVSFTEVSVKADFKFKEGSGFNDINKGVIFNNQTIIDDDSNNSIQAVNKEYSQNSVFSYKFFIETPLGNFESQLFSGKTTSAGADFSDFKAENISYRYADISLKYNNHYEGKELTTQKGFIIEVENSPYKTTYYSNDPDGQITMSIDTLYANRNHKITAFITNPYGGAGSFIEFDTEKTPYRVGTLEPDQGGMVSWIDYTGWRGIVVAPKQIYKKLKWTDQLDSSNDLILPWKTSIDKSEGVNNTNRIINYYSVLSNASAPAAQYVYDLEYSNYNDWHLPTYSEFRIVIEGIKRFWLRDGTNKYYDPDSDYYLPDLNNPGKTHDEYTRFWTSSTNSYDSNKAWSRQLYTGNDSQIEQEKTKEHWVMPIRRFNY